MCQNINRICKLSTQSIINPLTKLKAINAVNCNWQKASYEN